LVEDDKLLKPREIDSMLVLQLLVEGFAVKLTESGPGSGVDSDTETVPPPQVMFMPSGERTPFELALYYQDDESGYLLRVPSLGTVEQRRLEAPR
jgi:hypothetical protein